MFVYLVLHYKNGDVTEQCIDALLKTEIEDSHIVIVDNASDNGSYEQLVKKYGENERIHLIYNSTNLGYAAGNNVGYRYAKEVLGAEWIVLLNNDVIIEQKDFRNILISEYENCSFYLAGPDIVTPEGNSQNPFRGECSDIKSIRKSLLHDYVVLYLMKIKVQQLLKKMLHYDGSIFQHNEIETIRDFQGVLHGSCLVFSPQYVREFNGLYNDTFLYCEEEILCYILKNLGYRYSYLKSIQVVHKHSVSMKRAIKDEDQRKMVELSRRIDSYKKFLKIAKCKNNIGDFLK